MGLPPAAPNRPYVYKQSRDLHTAVAGACGNNDDVDDDDNDDLTM